MSSLGEAWYHPSMTAPVWLDPQVIEWSQWLVDSYRYWTSRDLIKPESDVQRRARALFEARFIVVSHGTETDPVLNYGNEAALRLWEMTWNEFVRTPSRLTAEPAEQVERERMLEAAKTRGYFEQYQGVRITSTGRRFLIENAVVWTVRDQRGATVGQAATFSRWTTV
ncbi:MAG TPA: MEKHLA domain-containing protein [Nitrospira sp.]|nr:MEKHLA domain-containing protein [Nitrospira sp.]